MAYYHRLDDLLKYAKKKAYHLEDWRDLSITINNLNKILTALVVHRYNYCNMKKVTFLRQRMISNAVSQNSYKMEPQKNEN